MSTSITETTALEMARAECRNGDLGDRRLLKRMMLILAAFLRRPSASTPGACGAWSFTKATYRFMNNDGFSAKDILAPHVMESVSRAQELACKDFLVLADTTMLDYTNRKMTEGFGFLSGNQSHKPLGLGLHLHTSLLVSEDGLPLGVLENHVWKRNPEDFGKKSERQISLSIHEKESGKWLTSLSAASRFKSALNDSSKRVIAVFDREGDIYSVFGEARQVHDVDFIVRAVHNRKISETELSPKLWDHVSQHEVGTMQFRVPRGKKGAQERDSQLTVYAAPVSLLEPPKRPKGERSYGEIPLNAVIVRETKAPESGKAIEWKLLTSLPIGSPEDVERIITYYRHRWMIERFFRTLKSGCKIEERQYATANGIEKCLALDSIVAWMILYLTVLGRVAPDLECTTVFEECEWQAAWVWLNESRDLPKKPPTLNEMVRMIGRLGGHLGRKGDGMPGSQTLWRGLQRLPDLAGMWSLLNKLPPPPDSRSLSIP